jgi:putative ATPase
MSRAPKRRGAAAESTRPGASRRGAPRLAAQLPRTPFADSSGAAPLAERLRPKTLDEVIGQQHLLGPGKPLRVAFESGRLHR